MLGAIKNKKTAKAKETCQDTIYMLGPRPSDHNLDML